MTVTGLGPGSAMVLLWRCRIANSAEQPTGTHDKQLLHPVPGPVINALSSEWKFALQHHRPVCEDWGRQQCWCCTGATSMQLLNFQLALFMGVRRADRADQSEIPINHWQRARRDRQHWSVYATSRLRHDSMQICPTELLEHELHAINMITCLRC